MSDERRSKSDRREEIETAGDRRELERRENETLVDFERRREACRREQQRREGSRRDRS